MEEERKHSTEYFLFKYVNWNHDCVLLALLNNSKILERVNNDRCVDVRLFPAVLPRRLGEGAPVAIDVTES